MFDTVSGPSWPRRGDEVVFIQIKVLKVSYFGRKGSKQGPPFGWIEQGVVQAAIVNISGSRRSIDWYACNRKAKQARDGDGDGRKDAEAEEENEK